MQVSKRQALLLVLVILALSLSIATPLTAHAATGPVTIDLSLLTGDRDNSSDAATDSQWSYDHIRRILSLETDLGVYTLTGSNPTLAIYANAVDAHITLSSISVEGDNTVGLGALTLAQSCTLTITGDNTLVAVTAAGLDLNADVTGIIDGDGTLTVTGSATGPGIALVDDTACLAITGSVRVFASGGPDRPSISDTGIFRIGEGGGAALRMTNNSDMAEVRTFSIYNPSGDFKWQVSDLWTMSWLLGSTIQTVLPPGESGTLTRVAQLTEPTLDVVLSNAALTFTFTEIGTTKGVTVTELWAGTEAIGDWDWEIVDFADPLVAYTPGSYGIYNAPIAVIATAPGTTVITVKVTEYQNGGLTDRFGFAYITVEVLDEDKGEDKEPLPPENKLPEAGDSSGIVMWLATLLTSGLVTGTTLVLRRRQPRM